MTSTLSTPTIAAQIEALAEKATIGSPGGRLDLASFVVTNLPAIVTALRQAEAAPGVVEGRVLVEQWRQEWLSSGGDHWGDMISWPSAREIAIRLDNAREALARQHGAGEDAAPSADAAMVEAVARIIDPSAWGELGHDSYLQRADEWFAKGRPEDDCLVGGYRQKAADMVKPSVAKARAALDLASRQPAIVGEGFVLVPREPTADILNAGYARLTSRLCEFGDKAEMIALWSAMIAAAPAADAGEEK